jgi:hypothetical protein
MKAFHALACYLFEDISLDSVLQEETSHQETQSSDLLKIPLSHSYRYSPIKSLIYSISGNILYLMHIDSSIIPCHLQYVNVLIFSSVLPNHLEHPLRKDFLS